jgi:ribonuclease HI
LIYSDGGSRGNPGPAASAFIALSENNALLMKDARCIGSGTNNQAEYEALIAALEFASKVKAEEVVCHLDSELVTKQLNGEYSVKDPKLKKLWLRVHDLAKGFKKVSYSNVPRTHPSIQAADTLVNEVLDKASRRI